MYRLTVYLHRFAALLADDNLSLQQELEALQAAIAKLSCRMLVGVRQDLVDADSNSKNDSNSNEANIFEVDHWKSRCELLRSLLSTFVPFERCASDLERASSILYERLLSSSDVEPDENASVEACERFTLDSTSQPLHVIQLDSSANLRSTVKDYSGLHAAAKISEEFAETEIQSYHIMLASYEHELNAAWSREAELHKELKSMRFTVSQGSLNHASNAFQSLAVFPTMSSSRPISNPATLKKPIHQASKILLETKIPPSDSSLNIIFNMQERHLFPLLFRQISAHHDYRLEMTRLSQHHIS
jgi:hypothetical protein